MKDTTGEMKQMQLKLHLELPVVERWARGFEMMENGRDAIISSIKNKNPDFSEADIFVALVRTMYKHDLTSEFLNDFEKCYRDRK
jgi:hypothetical protein